VARPGGSALREFERRRDAREQRVRERFPRIGGFLLAVTDEPQSTKAWDTGAAGEQVVGARLDGLTGDGLTVLHDRRIPGTRANIDHLVVSRAGVLGGSFTTRGVHVLWPKRLAQVVAAEPTTRGPETPAPIDVASVHARIARACPPA
jgi:hypothetical protein